MSRVCLLVVLFLCQLLLTPAPINAQERGGSITGVVTDASHDVLPGARIELQPVGQSAVSDQEGRFTITNVKAGEYTVTISYVGLSTLKKTTTVQAGQTINIDVVLQVPAVQEAVTVSADRPRGEAAALNEQRTSPNIVQILTSEVITSLPNTNVADAVGRLPSVSLERDEGEGKYVQIRGTDPRLSNLTVNGIHLASPESGPRNVKLDIVPSDLVGSIEVHKTLSADQDADAIGGSVNLVTKVPGEKPFASASFMGGYTNIIGGRGLTQFTGTAGSRFGATKQWGVLVGGSYDWNGRGIDDIEPGPDITDIGGHATPVFTGIDLREYRYYRSRVGLAGGLDYRGGGGSTAYVRGLFSNFRNYGDRWVYAPGAGDFLTSTTTDSNGTMDASLQNRRPNEQVLSLSGGARHVRGSLIIDYDLSGSHSRQNRLDQTSVNFAGPANVAYAVDATDPYLPTFTVLNGVNVYDPTKFTLSSLTVANERTAEGDFGGGVNVSKVYAKSGMPGILEFGARVRDAHKTNNVDDPAYDPTGAPLLTMNMVLGTFANPDYYSGHYTLGPLADLNQIITFTTNNPSALKLSVDKTRQKDSSNYDTSELVTAGYVMNSIDIGRGHLQAGLRVEGTHASYTGYHVTLDSHGHYVSTTPVSGTSDYTNAFPSVQYKFGFDANTDLRLSYGMGIARPNFGDLPPFIAENDKKQSISIGNPDLQPTLANNFDVLVERFFEPLGVVQAGAFYKALHDPIYSGVDSTVVGGIYDGYTQSQPINGPNAHVAGLELAWQQHLTSLPGFAAGFGVLANYSYTSSSATVPGRSDHPALLRQAPNNWNLGLTYDRARLSARLGVTHNDASIFEYNYQDGADGGLTGPLGDVYLYPHTQIDAQGSYAVARGVAMVVSLLNLNNEVFGFYQGSPQYQIQREFYNRTVSVGVRVTR
jgi:TonB-dependent receptor